MTTLLPTSTTSRRHRRADSQVTCTETTGSPALPAFVSRLVRVQVVHDRVAAAARDQPAVDRKRGNESDHQRHAEAPPEERVAEARRDRARDYQDERVVDDLHCRDRESVRRER